MNYETVEGLYSMCNRIDPALEEIEAYIKNHRMSDEEVTFAAIKLLSEYSFESENFEWQNGRKPEQNELVSSAFEALFDLFNRCGLDPNLVVYENENY